MKQYKKVVGIILLMAVLLLVACGGGTSSDEGKESKQESKVSKDGTINIAYPTNLTTLDPHLTTNSATRDVARQIFEQLLVLDENYEVQPSLAQSYDVSDDGLVYTFNLRQGVTFHNGKELVAEDIVASMDKWMETSSQGKANLVGAEFKEVDPHTVELHIEKASLVVPFVLADMAPFPAILPKESIEKAGADGLTEFIGTGPFKLEEWNVDQHIHLTRFDDYSSREEESSGLAGKKEALAKELYFHIVPDESTRLSGVSTGQYDIAFTIPFDNADQIEATEGVENVLNDAGILSYVLNKKTGPFSDQKFRQAFNTALDSEEVLRAAFSDDRFYTLDSALALPGTLWHSEAGKEFYNQHDLEKAKELVEESSYNGEEVTILTTRDYLHQYNAGVVAQQVLESIGVKVKLDVYDWPTLIERRTDENNFDVFPMNFAVRPTIHQNPFLDSKADYSGWSYSGKMDQLLVDINSAASLEDAKPLIDDLQQEVWDYLPIIKIGNIQDLVVVSDKITGYDNLIGPILWNVSKSE